MLWYCPNEHDIDFGLVCGGSDPYYLHGLVNKDEYGDMGNIYFYMDLETEELTKDVSTDIPFLLTDEDWKIMHDHALGGCITEPYCSECGSPLLEVGTYETIEEHNARIDAVIVQEFLDMDAEEFSDIRKIFSSVNTHGDKVKFLEASFDKFHKPNRAMQLYSMGIINIMFDGIGIAFRNTGIAKWYTHRGILLKRM